MTERVDRYSGTEPQIAAFRLRRHHLDVRVPRARLANVVGDVCGVQSQVTVMARLALWARIRQLTAEDVDRALVKNRSIIKTWSMRGALHLHASKEVLVVLRALMPTRLALEQRWIQRAELKEEETTAMVLSALKNGPLTRSQLVAYLGKRLGAKTKDWIDGGWGVKTVGSATTWFLVKPAMVRGLVCIAPRDGSELAFTRLDRWLRPPPPMPDEAEAEEAFVRRYLRSFGPADVEDLRLWSGIHTRRIRAILERLRDELVEVDRNGRLGFLLRKDLPDLEASEGAQGIVRLLPSFDSFVMGHRDRNHLVERAHYHQVYKDAGWLAPVVMRDGRIVGTWSYRRAGRKLEVLVQPFGPFDRELRDAVRDEANDLSRFLEAADHTCRFTA